MYIQFKETAMKQPDFKTFINEARENFKLSIDDLFNAIEILKDDVEELKTQKSNKLSLRGEPKARRGNPK